MHRGCIFTFGENSPPPGVSLRISDFSAHLDRGAHVCRTICLASVCPSCAGISIRTGGTLGYLICRWEHILVFNLVSVTFNAFPLWSDRWHHYQLPELGGAFMLIGYNLYAFSISDFKTMTRESLTLYCFIQKQNPIPVPANSEYLLSLLPANPPLFSW